MSNEFRPGQRLEPATLAEELVSSVTPVRDALHRLIGERLIEAHSGSGFHLTAIHEPDLRDLYGWNAHLLGVAMRWWPSTKDAPAPSLATDRVEATHALFHHFGTLSGNVEIIAAIDGISDRLSAVRAIEALAIGPIEEEIERITVAFDEGVTAIGRAVRAYHRRRLVAVPALIHALYRAD